MQPCDTPLASRPVRARPFWMERFEEPHQIADALGKAASSIFAVLEATAAMGERELQLVAAQDRLVAPPRAFKAEKL